MPEGTREQWGSRAGFILAATGSAVGLGNIWKFPFITGESGGAAFVLVYLVCVLLIGFPVMLLEFALGRRTRKNPVGAYKDTDKPGGAWFLAGAAGVLAGFIILSYYSVVAGWCFGYVVKALTGTFRAFEAPAMAAEHFAQTAESARWAVGYHILFMAVVVGIVLGGVRRGIERAAKILMPSLIVILVILMLRGLTLDGAGAGVAFLFKPDFSKISGDTILVALGHAFFTLSLGMGAMITYGSYLGEKVNLVTSAITVAFLDTLVALMAGVAIFTAVFAYGLEPNAGPGLLFHVLPAVFSEMPGGGIFGLLFFVLLSIAAITSGISLLEVVTAHYVDDRGWSRTQATLTFGLVIVLLGIPSALSFGQLADWHPLEGTAVVSIVIGVLGCMFAMLLGCFDFREGRMKLPEKAITISLFAGCLSMVVGGLWGKYPPFLTGWATSGWTFFDFADYFSFKYLLPLGGLLLAIFALKVWGVDEFIKELRRGGGIVPGAGVMRWVLAIAVLLTIVTFIAGLSGKT